MAELACAREPSTWPSTTIMVLNDFTDMHT
jgi:hypothetical protein